MGHVRIAERLELIRGMADPVARNMEITRCYCDLSQDLALVLGPSDLNWFTFGAWASATAGHAIRGESLPVDWGTSENVAAGNLAIIVDVAPPFIRWLAEIERAGGPTDEALSATLSDPRVRRGASARGRADGVPARLRSARCGMTRARTPSARPPSSCCSGTC